jgi:4-hydroxy-tetrahydrodipicolinate synthase
MGHENPGGVIPALIIPFREDGSIDYGLLEKQAAYLLSAGVHGMFINGSTAEGAYLTIEEKTQVLQRVKETLGGRIPLLAACINPSTAGTIGEFRTLEHLEPEYVVAVTPYYYRVTQEDVVDHFRILARHAPRPLVIYNIPQRTQNKIELSSIRMLSKEPNICGIKDSSGDFVSFACGVLGGDTGEFSWIQGDDRIELPSLLIGARGVVTGLGNVCIEPYVALYEAVRRGNAAEARNHQRRIHHLLNIIDAAKGKAIPAIKAACSLLGRSTKWMKNSHMTLTEAEIEAVRTALVSLDLV